MADGHYTGALPPLPDSSLAITPRLTQMRPTLLAALCVSLSACAPLPEHGPVDGDVLQKLEAHPITRAEFAQRLQSPSLQRSLTPAVPTVTVPFGLVSGIPWIKAGLNGRTGVPMMLDSGAARMLIHARTAADHGMPIVRAEEMQVQIHGVIGSEQGRVGLITPLQIGDWKIEGYPCYVRTQENKLGRQRFPSNIFGFDLPSRVCTYLTLDYPRRQVTFAFRDAYQPTPGMKVAHAPFRISQNVPFIKVTSKGHTWDCLVDTGSFNGVEINQELAVKLGVEKEGKIVQGMFLMSVGGTVSSADAGLRSVILPDITLLGSSFQQAQVDISPGIPRVGSYFLKDYRVTFDFRRSQIWLEWGR